MIWVLVTTLFTADPTVVAGFKGMTSSQVVISSEFQSEEACNSARDYMLSSPKPFGYTVNIDDCKIKERL